MRLSLCMIVRDEADCLARCLASADGVVDEVCVVDTGSTDETREIAVAAGARVDVLEWNDDFAAARNRSLAMATGEWILVLDADEELVSRDARASLDAFARREPLAAGHVWVVDRSGGVNEGRRQGITRFFPRALRPAFDGSIHERLLLDGRRPRRAQTGLEVHHYGYQDAVLERKGTLARNVRLLERALESEPRDAFLWYQLGRNRAAAGDAEHALVAFTSALDHVEREAGFLPSLIESTAYCLRSLGQWREAHELFSQLGTPYLNDPEMCFLGGLLAMDVGLLDRAEDRFQRCLRMARSGLALPATAYGAAYNLGVMREVLGLQLEARNYYERALALEPGHELSRRALDRLGA